MTVNALELQNVEIQFQSKTILKNLSLSISSGESFVIVGPSGQGKTVLLKTLAGLILPNKGKSYIEGEDWATLVGAKRLSILKKIGMLFQKNALFDSLTCLENIAFPLRETTNLSEPEILEKALFFLNAVAIPQAKDLFPDQISGGMQKRLGIARALALEPEIIFYDDPTAGLDPITSKKIIELILDLQKKKKSTLVTITNDMNRAYQLAHRIGIILDQELIIAGSAQETKSHSDLRIRNFTTGTA